MCLFLFSFPLHCWLYIVDFLPALHTFMIYWTSWWRNHTGSEKVMFSWCPLFPLLGRQDVVHSPQCSQALGWPGAHLHFGECWVAPGCGLRFLSECWAHLHVNSTERQGEVQLCPLQVPRSALQPPPSSASKFGKCLEQWNSSVWGRPTPSSRYFLF